MVVHILLFTIPQAHFVIFECDSGICFRDISFCKSFSFQVNYYVQSHIQMNEYRDRVVLVSASLFYRLSDK